MPAPTTAYWERAGTVMAAAFSSPIGRAIQIYVGRGPRSTPKARRVERGEPRGTLAAGERGDCDAGGRGERDTQHPVPRRDDHAGRSRNRTEQGEAVRGRRPEARPPIRDVAARCDPRAQVLLRLLDELTGPPRAGRTVLCVELEEARDPQPAVIRARADLRLTEVEGHRRDPRRDR